MADIDDIIIYLRSLKKGFDKDEFKDKIDELARVVDKEGLNYEEFHTLFKVWLNLTIPVTKWINVGVCLVPRESVSAETVHYTLRWLLSNYGLQNFTRIAFVLDWLTAAMDSDSIDVKSLDLGYEIFNAMFSYEILSPHVLKLLYTLSKPVDVNRRRVLTLLKLVKIRDGKKSKVNQVNVLLGLFKSYKPECVPENIPAVSVHSAFWKVRPLLVERFRRYQSARNGAIAITPRLQWWNPVNAFERGKGKKVNLLIPHMEFVSIGSTQYNEKEYLKNYLDFTESASLLEYSSRRDMPRPARLRAMLCNDTAQVLLAVASRDTHAFLSYDLHHLLKECFLCVSPYNYNEKADLLKRLVLFQRTLMQGIPVVTMFLAQYLPLWDEREYFEEILQLVEWLSIDSQTHLDVIVQTLGRIFHRSQPLEQCAILKALVRLYANLAYSRTRKKQYFMNMEVSQNYVEVMKELITFIGDLTNKALQIDPESWCMLYMSSWSLAVSMRAELRSEPVVVTVPPPLTLTLPLLSTSSIALDKVTLLFRLFREIYRDIKKKSPSPELTAMRNTMMAYSKDYVNALWDENYLSERKSGIIFKGLHPQLVAKLKRIPMAKSCFGLGSHLALAPYTYGQPDVPLDRSMTNEMWFDYVLAAEFDNIKNFLSN